MVDPPIGIEAGNPGLTEKTPPGSPTIDTPVIDRSTAPLFTISTHPVSEYPTATVPKSILVVEAVASGSAPVPNTVMVDGPSGSSDATVRSAVATPTTSGLNITVIVTEPPAGTTPGQTMPLVSNDESDKEIPEIVRSALPSLPTISVRVSLCPTSTTPKSIDVVDSVMFGIDSKPVPPNTTIATPSGSLEAIVSSPEAEPDATGANVTSSVAVAPGARATGNPVISTENSAASITAPDTSMSITSSFVSVTDIVLLDPTSTSPKSTVAGAIDRPAPSVPVASTGSASVLDAAITSPSSVPAEGSDSASVLDAAVTSPSTVVEETSGSTSVLDTADRSESAASVGRSGSASADVTPRVSSAPSVDLIRPVPVCARPRTCPSSWRITVRRSMWPVSPGKLADHPHPAALMSTVITVLVALARPRPPRSDDAAVTAARSASGTTATQSPFARARADDTSVSATAISVAVVGAAPAATMSSAAGSELARDEATGD